MRTRKIGQEKMLARTPETHTKQRRHRSKKNHKTKDKKKTIGKESTNFEDALPCVCFLSLVSYLIVWEYVYVFDFKMLQRRFFPLLAKQQKRIKLMYLNTFFFISLNNWDEIQERK